MKKQELSYSEVTKSALSGETNVPLITREHFARTEHDPSSWYQQLFETAVDAVLVCDLDGLVVQANRRTEVLLGCPRHAMIGCHYLELFSPMTAPFLVQQLMPTLLSDDPVSVEAEMVRSDNTCIPVEVRATLVGDSCELTQQMQIVVRDIAQKKQADRQRADFLEMLAHDIRSPLSVVVGYADLLVSTAQRQPDCEDVDMLLSLRSGAFSLANLVLNYLDVAKIEARPLLLAKTPVAVNEVLCRVGRQYEQEAQRLLVDLKMALCESLAPVVGDRLAIERIITNLLHNALKFTPAKGRVTLSSMMSQDGHVVVSVTDTGPGLSTDEIAVVFEKYRTARKDRKKEGSGLGLFIVKALAEGHGGRVEVDSTLGVGTCISVILPALANCKSDRTEKW